LIILSWPGICSRRFTKQQRAKLPSFRILFVKTNQEYDRICALNHHSSFRDSGFAGNQEPLSASALFLDGEDLCILHDNTWKQVLLAVEVLRRAEIECSSKPHLRTKSLSLSELFNVNSSSAGFRASIGDCMNLPVLQINALSELLVIGPSTAHVLRDIRWLEPVVTPLSQSSSALSHCSASSQHGLRTHACRRTRRDDNVSRSAAELDVKLDVIFDHGTNGDKL
jgi:hypothetical protein